MVNLENLAKAAGTYCFGTPKEIEELRADPDRRSWYNLMTYAHVTVSVATLFVPILRPLRPLMMVANTDFAWRIKQSVTDDTPLSQAPGMLGYYRAQWLKKKESSKTPPTSP